MNKKINQIIEKFGTENLAELCQAIKIVLSFEDINHECNLFRRKKEMYIELIADNKRYIIEKTGIKNL